jgi:hypothetical protein
MLNLDDKMLYLHQINAYFLNSYQLLSRATWFKRALYVLLIIKCLYYLEYYHVLFGNSSIVYLSPARTGFFKDIPFLLYNMSGDRVAYWFIGGVLTISIFNLLLPRIYFIADFVLWLLVLNLHNRIYPALSGGDYFTNQLLFFNCFIAARSFRQENIIPLHNLGVVAIIVQVMVVYLVSAIAKIGDPLWRSGEAIGIIMQLQHFSWQPANGNPFLTPLFFPLAWAVIIYQLFFPALLLLKKLKKMVLAIGIVMHLYIALIMGLVTFGTIMLICYLFFWPVKQAHQ